MTFSKYREESRPIFVSLKLTNIYDLNMYFIAPFRYLYFHDKLLMFFKNYFKTNDNIQSTIHDHPQVSTLLIKGL